MSAKKISSREVLLTKSDDEIVVFKTFEQNLQLEESGPGVIFPGVIFSCKGLLKNLEEAVSIQHVLTMMTDTTFKLIVGQWVLMITGVIDTVVKSQGNTITHSFRPILFGLALSENIVGYTALFSTILELAEWAFAIPLRITKIVHCQDRNDAMCNAFQSTFQNCQVIIKPCIVHILRNVRQNARLMVQRDFLEVKLMCP